ncbi:hypothetical protein K1719_009499 [Acacia pycnantha]|nr:hypothetical protein K1719_009499 [Acacia pycnantha]
MMEEELRRMKEASQSDPSIAIRAPASSSSQKWKAARMKGTIVADDTWWEAKIKDNSKYARFRYQGLEFCEDQLEIIFGETVATSQRSWTPATGATSEDSAIKTNPTIPEEIAEYDEEETNPNEDASNMVNNQLKREKMASEAMSKNLAKGKQKSGIATSMLKTLDRMANAAESHNAAEVFEMSQTSEINGHFSIPDGIKILRNLKAKGKLDAKQYFYAIDLLRMQQERIIIMSFSKSTDELVGWILYKYELDKRSSD